jgi:hypothetical protein
MWYRALGLQNWTINLNTTGFENGEHTVYARAYDGVFYSDIENSSITINVNNKVPVDDIEIGTESEEGSTWNFIQVIGLVIVLIFIIILIVILIIRRKIPPPQINNRIKPGRELHDSSINSPLRKL